MVLLGTIVVETPRGFDMLHQKIIVQRVPVENFEWRVVLYIDADTGNSAVSMGTVAYWAGRSLSYVSRVIKKLKNRDTRFNGTVLEPYIGLENRTLYKFPVIDTMTIDTEFAAAFVQYELDSGNMAAGVPGEYKAQDWVKLQTGFLGKPMQPLAPEREKVEIMDLLLGAMLKANQLPEIERAIATKMLMSQLHQLTPQMSPTICITRRAQEIGVAVADTDLREVSTAIMHTYYTTYGKYPPKVWRYVGGRNVQVNAYWEQDLPIIDSVLRTYARMKQGVYN